MGYLLDTNIITAHLKNDEKIRAKIKEANFQEENLYISIISYYETKRGLLYANATRKLSKFNTFCEAVTVAFYVGASVARYWQERGHLVTATTTTTARVTELEKVAARVVVMDETDALSVQSLVQNQQIVLAWEI